MTFRSHSNNGMLSFYIYSRCGIHLLYDTCAANRFFPEYLTLEKVILINDSITANVEVYEEENTHLIIRDYFIYDTLYIVGFSRYGCTVTLEMSEDSPTI